MGAAQEIALPSEVLPGYVVDISVDFIAPSEPGTYEAFWMLQTPEGKKFGVGSAADKAIWTKVKVLVPPAATATSTPEPPTPVDTGLPATVPPQANVSYDFISETCLAQWKNSAVSLPCQGAEGDTQGFIRTVEQPRMENGEISSLPGLLMVPSNSETGYVQGVFPEYEIQAGDHLQATVGCEYGFAPCSMLFRIAYQDSSETMTDLWSIGEFYDGQSFDLDLDLSPLAGRKVRLILSVSPLGDPNGDRALWIAPRITRTLVPTTTPEPTATIMPTNTPIPGSPTPSQTPTAAASPTFTATPIPSNVSPGTPSVLEQIIQWIGSFFRKLFGS